jgi:hypothetical protein
MTTLRLGIALTAAALPLAACTPNSATQVLSDTSYNIAMAERFGRMDIVIDQVAPAKRDAFTKAHADWGGLIRIVDLEYQGMRLADPAHADITLIVSWQRLDDASLRETTVKQTWFHGESWVITKEARVSGDTGLLDEPDPKVEGGKKSGAPIERSHKSEHVDPPPDLMSQGFTLSPE